MSHLPNPFARPQMAAAPTEESWGIAASGPPVDPREIETEQRAAEVVILWGDDVLHVAHVSPPRDVVIGESSGSPTDYAISRDILGTERLPIVVERNGQLFCVVPEGASGTVTIGDAHKKLEELETVPFSDLSGAKLYAMPEGASARVEHRGLAFLVRPTSAAKKIGASTTFRWRHAGWVGLSLAVHGFMLMLFYFMPPQTSALSIEDTNARARMAEYLVEAPQAVEPEFEQPVTEQVSESGGQGQRHADSEGQMGDPSHQRTRNRYGVEGEPNDRNPELARENLRNSIPNVGALGALRAAMGSWNTPTSPYGADFAHGNDAMSAIGALMGDQTGQNFGFGGMGMQGTGLGGGGFGLGTIGVGRLGTIGHGGDGEGPGNGYGGGVDLNPGGHVSRVPTIHTPPAHVIGSLSAEAIRRVVRQHISEVRFCYEQGLQSNPSMEGRVAVSWIISGTGAVQSSALASSDLRNDRVEGCIVQAVRRWTFPTPEDNGVVGVNYPFVLDTN